MASSVFLGLALVGALANVSVLLFFAFYRFLPFRAATIENTTESEISRGNAVLITIFVTYKVDGRRKSTSISKSSYQSQQQQLRYQVEEVRKFYSGGLVHFYHLPGLRFVGLLESPVIYPEVQLLTAGLFLYAIIVTAAWNFWY